MNVVERAIRDTHESQMTRDEAIEWAKEQHARTGKWPVRRYRLRTSFGNSRLLRLDMAQRDQGRYGGAVVELIPSRQEFLEAERASQTGGKA